MKIPAFALAVAGCTTTPHPYQVDAIAPLMPVGTTDVGIDGPIEVLGTGTPSKKLDFVRTIAAYQVRLPEGAAPWVRLYTAPSCAEPGAAPMLFGDLGTIRRVGDETHFFARDVTIGDRTLDIDTETVSTYASLSPDVSGYLFAMIAVVQAPGDGTAAPGPDGVPAGGPWLACAAFEPVR